MSNSLDIGIFSLISVQLFSRFSRKVVHSLALALTYSLNHLANKLLPTISSLIRDYTVYKCSLVPRLIVCSLVPRPGKTPTWHKLVLRRRNESEPKPSVARPYMRRPCRGSRGKIPGGLLAPFFAYCKKLSKTVAREGLGTRLACPHYTFTRNSFTTALLDIHVFPS